MRRRAGILVICFLIVTALALAGTVCMAQTASVTVKVTVSSSIHVSDNGVGTSNIKVVRLDSPARITYVAP
jgi:hypothetical protein